MPISPIGTAIPAAGGAAASPAAAGAAAPGAFADSLKKLVTSVEAAETTANETVSSMLQGDAEVHDAMIALQRADLSLQFTVQVRNKLVQAYNEIMRMPV